MKKTLNRLSTTLAITLLAGCANKYSYKEIYVKECDYSFKEIKYTSSDLSPPYYLCADTSCLSSFAVFTGIFKGAEKVDQTIQQAKNWQDFKKACAQKGITVTKYPKEQRIYLNKRPPIIKKNSDSELSEIER